MPRAVTLPGYPADTWHKKTVCAIYFGSDKVRVIGVIGLIGLREGQRSAD